MKLDHEFVNRNNVKLLVNSALLSLATLANAQPYSIDWHSIDGGGGTSAGGGYSLSATIGQADDGTIMSGGGYTLEGGFWSMVAAVTPAVTIFNNTNGSFNGVSEATTNNWQANKICLGPRAYGLESATLLLSSQDYSGTGPHSSTVRLQIYSNDPVSGTPSASLGVMMNLSGVTNPITLPAGNVETPVTWTPATLFTLSPNACYWIVLDVQNGASVWQTATFTVPAGEAGTFGRVSSPNAGATWPTPDNTSNRKMLIQAIPISAPSSGPETAADGATAIPGGTGNFTSLPLAPGLSGDSLVFYGAGSGGQQGIYLATRGLIPNPTRIADLRTPIPNGTGNFLSLGTEAGIIIVGGNVLFSGRGSGSQQGIYLASRSAPQESVRIADTATPIPGGVGTFTGFQNALGFSGSAVALVGSGSGGQQGLYTVAVLAAPQVGSPLRIADTATPIPGGHGNFTAFPSGPALSGSGVAFIGNGSGGQQGIYGASVALIGPPFKVADTTTAIPGGSGNFTAFGSDQAHPVDPAVSGDRLVFVGSGSGGQQGIYGASVSAVGPPYKVADTASAIPGGSGNFASFGAVSVSPTDVAFLGHGASGQTGIYDMTGGQLRKVISVGESISGKTIAGLNFSRSGLFGDPIAFAATFSDGSQGVYILDAAPPSSELVIIAADRIGNDLRLRFTSVAGQNYAIQSRADLSFGAWTNLPGAPTPGTGGTAQVTLPNAFDQSRQFYRVQVVP